MAIITPDQGTLDLSQGRGSAIQAQDTYARPAMPQDNGAVDQLASALNKFGANITAFGEADKAKQEQLDGMRIDMYKTRIQSDFQSGLPVQAQVDSNLANKSPIIRARVGEALGLDAAQTWTQKRHMDLLNDPELRNDPDKFNAALARISQEALEYAKPQGEAYASGFGKAVKAYNDPFMAQAHADRMKRWDELQKDSYRWNVIQGSRDAASGGLQYKTVAQVAASGGPSFSNVRSILSSDKGAEHVDNMNAAFAGRLETMLADAPPEIKAQLKIISGFRSTSRQQELYNTAIARYGSPEAARQWVAPPGRSNHNHGEATDFGGGASFKTTEAGKWVHANAEKYGLYFPMAHEPWHIEMREGRREGGRTRVSSGEDVGTKTELRARRLISTESSGNPNAQSNSSSASGLGGYTNGTWIERVRQHAPELASGKNDVQILAMKANPDLQNRIVRKDVEMYEAVLKRQGLSDTDGNVKLLHFAGMTGGEKVIRANEGTPVRQLLSADAIAANPTIANMTAGQMRQWAEESMGGASTAAGRARNAIRQTDREWSTTSRLNNAMRRDAAAGALYDQAIKSNDTSWLDMMPPELMDLKTQGDFAQARATIGKAKKEADEYAYKVKQREDAQVASDLYDAGYSKLARGEQIDPLQAAIDPRTGKLNTAVHAQLAAARDKNINLLERDSKFASMNLGQQLEAIAAWGDPEAAKQLFPDLPAGRGPSVTDVNNLIKNHPEIKTEDAVKLAEGIHKRMDQMGTMLTEENKEFFNTFVKTALPEMKDEFFTKAFGALGGAQMVQQANIVYFKSMQSQWKQTIEDNGGKNPTLAQIKQIRTDAAQLALNNLKNTQEFIKANAGKEIPAASLTTVPPTVIPLDGGRTMLVPGNAPKVEQLTGGTPAANTPATGTTTAATTPPQGAAPVTPTTAPTITEAASGITARVVEGVRSQATLNRPESQMITPDMTPAQKAEIRRAENPAGDNQAMKAVEKAVVAFTNGAIKNVDGFLKSATDWIANTVQERRTEVAVREFIKTTPALKDEMEGYEKQLMTAKSRKDQIAIGAKIYERFGEIRASMPSKPDQKTNSAANASINLSTPADRLK